jgi:hypothetical protein
VNIFIPTHGTVMYLNVHSKTDVSLAPSQRMDRNIDLALIQWGQGPVTVMIIIASNNSSSGAGHEDE